MSDERKDVLKVTLALVLLFSVLSCGLFLVAWDIVQAAWMKKVLPTSKALSWYIAAACCQAMIFSSSFYSTLTHSHGHPATSLIHRDVGGHIDGAIQPEKFSRRTLQRRRTSRSFVERCYDLLLRRNLLPISLERHRSAKAFGDDRGCKRVSPAQRKLSANIALLSVALATVVLLRFPPAEYSFYPRCPIFASLHLLCPGCGATRALAALLRLRITRGTRLESASRRYAAADCSLSRPVLSACDSTE